MRNYRSPAVPILPTQWCSRGQKKAALQALYFRPYANTYQVGLYQQRSGQAKEAAEWLQKTYEDYPYMLPLYSERIYASPYFHSLRAQVADKLPRFCPKPRRNQTMHSGAALSV